MKARATLMMLAGFVALSALTWGTAQQPPAPTSPFFVDIFGARAGSTAYAHANSVAIQKAINAAMPTGGCIQFGPGTYFFDTPIVADGAKSLVLCGQSPGVASGNAFGSSLNYTGGGIASALSFKSCVGCKFQNLKLGWSCTVSPGFQGVLLDFRKGTSNDSAMNAIEGVQFFHQDGALNAAASCLHVGGNFGFSARSCQFSGGQHCVIGRDPTGAADWSNTIHFESCYFQGAHLSLVHNVYQSWQLSNCALEPLDDGLTIQGVTNDPGLPPLNLMLIGCWMGDGDKSGKAGGSWIHWGGPSYGLSVIGGMIGINGTATGVKIDGDGCQGITIQGVQWIGGQALAGVDFGTTKGHTGVCVFGNSWNGVKTPIAGTVPAGAFIN